MSVLGLNVRTGGTVPFSAPCIRKLKRVMERSNSSVTGPLNVMPLIIQHLKN